MYCALPRIAIATHQRAALQILLHKLECGEILFSSLECGTLHGVAGGNGIIG